MEVISLGVAFTALIASCGAAFWAGRIDGRLNNGLSENIRNLREDIGKMFDRVDKLPCGAHVERLKHVEQSLDRLARAVTLNGGNE